MECENLDRTLVWGRIGLKIYSWNNSGYWSKVQKLDDTIKLFLFLLGMAM